MCSRSRCRSNRPTPQETARGARSTIPSWNSTSGYRRTSSGASWGCSPSSSSAGGLHRLPSSTRRVRATPRVQNALLREAIGERCRWRQRLTVAVIERATNGHAEEVGAGAEGATGRIARTVCEVAAGYARECATRLREEQLFADETECALFAVNGQRRWLIRARGDGAECHCRKRSLIQSQMDCREIIGRHRLS